MPEPRPLPHLLLAIALSLGAAVSLGITRFAYALLLPPMRADLQWSYTLAGAMNTANALGYLLGALATPALMARAGPSRLLLGGSVLASVFMALSGFFTDATLLLLQRALAGVASAFLFIAGGLLAARLGALQPRRAGLLLATLVLAWPARVLADVHAASGQAPADGRRFRVRDFAPGLAAYAMFGVGYIGYMTFVVALLREQGVPPAQVTLFYALLGVAVVASSRIWAGLLDRYKEGQPLAILNALVGLATIVPALTAQWPLLLASGLLFGTVFLSVVASTTALVRHNLPASQWAAGISAFTIVFAAGQIVGPTVVGWIADGPGGLARGLLVSAGALWLGSVLALRQRPLHDRAG
jgi:predicted MFS family arabinose efflux permease